VSDNEIFRYNTDREIYSAAKVRALEALLIEKGIISNKTIDKVLDFFETEMGPFNGAKIVARAWVDAGFKKRLIEDAPSAIAELKLPDGMAGAEGEHVKVAENTADVHNVIICTLCSCYPWTTLGLPPYWFKDPTFRARIAREPRAVLKEFGLEIPEEVEIKLWDSSAQIRWMVLPERPAGTSKMNEAELAALLTPEAMMGVASVAV